MSWNVAVPTSLDWIGFYQTGAPNAAYLDWYYDNSCTKTPSNTAEGAGSCGYTMPAASGTYEFRLFTNNSYIVLATSDTVFVD